MATMLQYTELTEQQREYLLVITQSISLLMSMLNTFLDLAKIRSGMFELEHKPFNIVKCITKLCNLFKATAMEKHIELQFHTSDQLPERVQGDKHRLRQVLLNLLSNAIKFTKEYGHISVHVQLLPSTTSENRYRFLFAVQDDGIGIVESKVYRNYIVVIFTRFQPCFNRLRKWILASRVNLVAQVWVCQFAKNCVP